MSTRACIARPYGEGFRGVYHHWDGYPSGLGASLYRLRWLRYGGDTEAMAAELIDAHPAGWSTINGADWSLPIGFVELDSHDGVPCATCGADWQSHYCQYRKDGHPQPFPCPGGYGYHAGHGYVPEPEAQARADALRNRPQCYCHGDRHEDAQELTEANASGCGVEYVYLLDGDTLRILSSVYPDSGEKMTGMFGSGADHVRWVALADVPFDSPEPDWDKINEVAYA